MTMEKKRKLTEPDTVEREKLIIKKKKRNSKKGNETANDTDSSNNEVNESPSKNTLSEKDDTKKEKSKVKKIDSENGQIAEENEPESSLNESNNERVNTSESKEPDEIDGDGINTPTTKKPPRKSGETKKQYKRRMKALREAGLLIDPPVVEGVKKDKKNRKTRKEKRMAIQKKNEELDKFRSIVQINYLKAWKTNPTKWKFNKNVQGKIIKHMFDQSRIPQDIFEILIEYIMGTKKATKMHEEINKKCSQVVDAMEKWTSADDEGKKKLTEPDKDVYDRARQVMQSLT